MAPKQIKYDAIAMQWKADESAVNELENLAQEGIELPRTAEVSCEYLGVHTEDGFTLDARPTGRSTVGFKWSYRDRDNTAAFTQTKQARCDYAADQGSSLPEDWKTALKCRRIPRIAQEAQLSLPSSQDWWM